METDHPTEFSRGLQAVAVPGGRWMGRGCHAKRKFLSSKQAYHLFRHGMHACTPTSETQHASAKGRHAEGTKCRLWQLFLVLLQAKCELVSLR